MRGPASSREYRGDNFGLEMKDSMRNQFTNAVSSPCVLDISLSIRGPWLGVILLSPFHP